MGNNGLFIGGLPTEPDVKKLLAAYPDLKPGTVLEHKQIEAVLDVKHGSSRYRTVTGAWRRHLLRLSNIDMQARAGVGFVVLGDFERVEAGINDYASGVRRVVKSVTRAKRAHIERLPEDQQRVVEHALRHMESTASQARTDSKQIAVKFTPQAQLPRLRVAK